MAEIGQKVSTDLGRMLNSVLSKADDWLFDLAQREGEAIDPFNRSPHMEAMKMLRGARERLEQTYRDEALASFTRLFAKAKDDKDQQSLSLVGEEELEQQLSADLVAETLRRAFGVNLDRVAARFAKLMGLAAIDEKINPLSAHAVAHLPNRAFKGLELPANLQTILFKYYERELQNRFQSILEFAEQKLHAAGIRIAEERRPLPERKAPEQRPQEQQEDSFATRERDDQASSASASRGGEREAVASEDRAMFSALRELLKLWRPTVAEKQDAQPRTRSGRTRVLQTGEVLSVLSILQEDPPSSILQSLVTQTLGETEMPLSVLLKRDLLASANRIGLSPDEVSMSADEEDAVDLVGMLFDVMLDERDFENQARSLIAKLVIPFVKVALLDRRMFLHRGHPARRLLNSVAEACEGNRAEGPHERELLNKAENVVGRLVAEFNEDLAVFELLELELRGYLEQHTRRVEIAEKRAAEAQRGQERLEQARKLAAQTLAECTKGRKLPSSLHDFFTKQWSHHLTLTALRDGEDSEAWKATVDLAKELVGRMGGPDKPALKAEVNDYKVRTPMRDVFASSGLDQGSADQAIDALLKSIELSGLSELSAVIPMREVKAEDLVVPTRQAEGLRVVGGRDTLDFDPADIEPLSQLQIGAWLNIAVEDVRMHPAKLAWVSPSSQRRMFVNRRGVRILVASIEELAAMKKAGRLLLREQDNAFDDAMHRMLDKLQAET